MHPCLRLDEILSLIATLVGGDDRTATLSKMALTCKKFNGPAVDALWEEIPGLRPLLPLLPSDAYVIEQKGKACVLKITRSISQLEWGRVDHATRYVRALSLTLPPLESGIVNPCVNPCVNLCINPCVNPCVNPCALSHDSDTMRFFRERCPARILFPNLRKIVIDEAPQDFRIQEFLSPSLQDVKLRDSGPEAHQSQMRFVTALNSASQTCNIRFLDVGTACNLNFGHGFKEPPLVEALSQLVVRQTRLVQLQAPSHISAQAWSHLAQLPRLQTLNLDFFTKQYRGFPGPSPTNFSSLTSLRIRPITFNGDVGTEFISFLGDLAQHSRLRELELTFSVTNKESLANVFDTVSRFGLLEYCTLHYIPTEHVDWDEPVPAEIMEPLYRIRGMAELDLAMLPMVVTPDAVSKMALSWPEISILYLGEESPKSIASLELQDLAPLAIHNYPSFLGFKIRSTARRGFVGNGNKIPVQVDMGCSSLTLAHAAPMAEVFVELFPAGELYAGADDAEDDERRRVVEEINRCIASHKPEAKE